MLTRNIDDQIRDYYASQKPSPQMIEQAKQLIRSGAPVRQPRRAWIAAAAVIVLASLSFLWTSASHTVQSPQQLAVSLAHQAALGHNQKQQLEFRVNDCAELQREMKSLDFTPVEPAMMREMKMRIIGARYTTMAGQMAAQILYLDEKGIPCTLYEVRAAGQLARVAAGVHEIDGLRVSLWREKGLFMVLTQPIA